MTRVLSISEESLKLLEKIKKPSQTYEDILTELIQAHNRRVLASKIRAAEKGEGNWTNLEDI